MQKANVISVKDAAELLELDERSVRERLINGSLKGEKRSVGQREKWFVYANAIELELKQKRSSQSAAEMLKYPPADNHAMNFSPEVQSGAGQQMMQPQPPAMQWQQAQQMQVPVNPSQGQMQQQSVQYPYGVSNLQGGNGVQPFTGMVAAGEDVHSILAVAEEAIVDVQSSSASKTSGEKERESLKELLEPLLERLEKQRSELDQKERIIEEQKEQLRLLPDLQARKAELENKIEGERKVAEISYAKAQALEEKLSEKDAEVIRIKAEKDVETRMIQEQLSKLTQKLEKLELPWWKKLFAAPEENEK